MMVIRDNSFASSVWFPNLKISTVRQIIVAVLLAVFSSTSLADDWGQWRGGQLNSVSAETGLPTKWSESDGQLWRAELPGPAGSSPVVAGDRIFVSTVDGQRLALLCFDKNGTELWRRYLKGQNRDSRDGGNSAAASPLTDGEHVWVMMGNGMLACFDFEGRVQWEKDLQKKYGEFKITFGMSTTPVLSEGNLFISLIHGDRRSASTSVATILNLDADTGNENWAIQRKTDAVRECRHAYCSPIVANVAGTKQLVIHGADYVTGYEVATGNELWRAGGINIKGASYNPTLRFVSSPVADNEFLVVPSAKKGPVFGYRIHDDSLEEVWKLPQGTPDVASPVIYDGFVFLAGERGVLSVLDRTNGKVVTRKRLMADRHRSTPVAADGKLYIADRKGTVWVVAANASLDVLGKNKLNEDTLASPAISDGRIYVRTSKALYAFGQR